MRTFLDTNVLFTAFRGTDELAERALELIADTTRQFLGSDFLKLEVLPKPTYHRQTEEREFYEAYFASLQQVIDTTPAHIESAFVLATTYGLSGPDALLAQAAITARAQEFVTLEKKKALFRIPAGTLIVRSLRT
jgi:predicted nucleic acid-binding protein